MDTEEAYINLALLALQSGDIEHALALSNEAYERFEYSIRICMTYSLILMITGNFRESISIIKSIVIENAPPANAYYIQSMCYFILGQYEKAYVAIRIAFNLNQHNKDIVFLYSKLCEKRKEYQKAIDALENLLPLDNTDIRIWQTIARNYYKLQKNENAKKALQAISALSEDSGWVWNNLALIAMKQRENERANKLFLHAIKLSDDPIIIMNYSSFLYQINSYDQVILLYSAFGKTKQTTAFSDTEFKSFECYINSLKMLKKDREYRDALWGMYKNGEFSITTRITLLNYLVCFYCTDDKDTRNGYAFINELEDFVRNGVIPHSDYNKTINNIIFAYLEFGDLINAEKYVNIIASRLDESPFLNATYGLYYFLKNNAIKGEVFYEKAIRFATDSVIKDKIRRKKNLEIGKLQLRENRIPNAKRFIEKAIGDIDFITREAKNILVKL
jgi:tetratricopeptide (TPR) repeat protein